MNVFDFDNTLYRGESSLDLALYMIGENKRILLYLPVILRYAVQYKLCLVSRQRLEATIEKLLWRIIKDRQSTEKTVRGFWEKHRRDLDADMLRRVGRDDLIVTAGPRFLLDGIAELLNTKNVICSEVDLDRRTIVYLNFADNKVNRYRELYGDRRIDCFYTDSYNDRALMDISDNVFLVKKGKITQIKET